MTNISPLPAVLSTLVFVTSITDNASDSGLLRLMPLDGAQWWIIAPIGKKSEHNKLVMECFRDNEWDLNQPARNLNIFGRILN